jgi:formate hydrogenlyase subunit 3/multisubunit Na+/H+ antiporter MnhD subunit
VSALLEHLAVLPIAVPLLAGAAMLLVSESRHTTRLVLAFTSLLVQLGAALALLIVTSDATREVWPEGIYVYAIGSWPAPFGIVLVVDRLSALMLTLTAIVGLATVLYSTAHWDRPGQPFHPLNQFLLVGLNGAFLTGDLFNLFVFFEVLLAASYGLLLRGVGTRRVRDTLHYVAVNLVASYLFLLGVALIYGTLGTLNMADLLGRSAVLAPSDRSLFHVGAALLGVAFLVKAASWPLNFWLPSSYTAAVPPVSAGFALLTKVGVYAVLRIGTLMGEDQAAAAILGPILFYLGLVTLASGTIGMLATQHLKRLVSYSVIVSSGLLLAALGLGDEALTAPVLFYLVTSVLTSAAFFMLTGMTDRTRIASAPRGGETNERDDSDHGDDRSTTHERDHSAHGDDRSKTHERDDSAHGDARGERPRPGDDRPGDRPQAAEDRGPKRPDGGGGRVPARSRSPWRPAFLRIPLPSYLAFGVREPRPYDTGEEIGMAIPAATAFLGLMFVCCVLLVTGLPPLPTFIAKFGLLAEALDGSPSGLVSGQAWAFVIAVVVNGFAGLVALTRVGIRLFWSGDRRTPRLRVLEAAPVALLIAVCLGLTAAAGPAMSFFEQTARLLHAPEIYMRSVLSPHVEPLGSSAKPP